MKSLLMLSILSFSTFTYGYSNTLTFTGKIVAPACKVQIINGQAVLTKKEMNCVPMNKSTEKYVYKSQNIQTHPSGKIITISYL
ncbi:hypothetical protein UB37_07275 [Photobacterium iliopiscarium]|uniref:Type 1 fimbrial protein n=1 Tax=Photobacterium iliopiscarium TaxID=56192 RepID=A0ABX5GSK4_9GAMM|nr:hypothetical protein [Photobacterium iliopiscarium]KJG23040.1 hypothetical protein UB37_07275 [Photobacterium iliopiscarium]PSW96671.1 hypothetical protein C9J52_09605 [Photobacterium iliopiscarium]